MHRTAIQFYLAFLVVPLMSLGAAAEPKFDVLIKDGKIVDGSGAPWYEADVGILDGKIVRIGNLGDKEATTVIDAAGLIVAPGFIDMMGQTASPMLEDPATALNLLTQGITTINAGEGGSAAPLSELEGQRAGYTTMAEYFALVESKGLPLNLVQTIGHTQVRRIVLGDVERRPSDEELKLMQALVREAMEAGAIGVSTALIYPPAIYAPTKEIAALATVAGEYGGRYYTHMRNEGDRLLEAIDEALDIGREGNTPVHIFHLKAAGQRNWGKMQLALAKIRAARAEGQQVTADIYPYVNNGLGIAALVHPRHFADGRQRLLDRLDSQELRNEIKTEIESTDGWENWFLHAGKDWNRIIIGSSNSPTYKPYDGQSLAAMAKACNEDPWDTFFNLVRSDAFALPETMTEANKILAIQQEFVSFCTDVGPTDGRRSASHPRAYGSFPRLIARYVRDLGAISLEQAISQASAAAANDVLAYDRGRIAVGLAADVIMFDYEHLTDKADFQNPDAVSEGVKHVMVNGQLVLHNSKFTGSLPGRVLRGPGYQQERAAFNVASDNNSDAHFANIDRDMQEFMQQHRLPGASLAVTNNGRIVYARGYGYADIATKKQVEPNSLFRIASLSKPLTAVAILQLVEQGKLGLQEKVMETLDYQRDIATIAEFDERLKDITIEHLLEHRGGWDRDKSFDAMFQSVRFANLAGIPPPADQASIIKVMLSQKLDFDPGERYAYSNFGYCLLGRVIERRSGQAYDDYVNEHVLGPLGITSMKLGSTRLAGRAENEVRYYHAGTGKSVFALDLDQTVPWPYGAWNLEAMDSHGGWLATASDLAKFAAAFDDPEHCLILRKESIDRMYQRPPGLAGYTADGKEKPTYYSLGWSNQQVDQGLNHSHTGSLPGTATILFRRYDGKNFVVLLNSRTSPAASHLGRAMEPLLREMSVDIAAQSVSIEAGERIPK